MKKLLLLLIPLTLLFSGCWIEPHYGDYKENNNEWYFADYDTLKSIMIPKINKAYSEWHWSKREFDTKYQKYLNNTDLNTELYDALMDSDYNYYVKYGFSNNTVYYYDNNGKLKPIKNSYFLFIERNKNTVVLFQL